MTVALYRCDMKPKHSSPNQNTRTFLSAEAATSIDFNQSEPAFALSDDDVAMRAYLNYVSNGSQPGHDVEHWLAAETQLLAELSGAISPEYHERT